MLPTKTTALRKKAKARVNSNNKMSEGTKKRSKKIKKSEEEE